MYDIGKQASFKIAAGESGADGMFFFWCCRYQIMQAVTPNSVFEMERKWLKT